MGLSQVLFSASGRVSRKAYWLCTLGLTIASFALVGVGFLLGNPIWIDGQVFIINQGAPLAILVALGLLYVVICFSGLLISIKRCHDRGRSGWFILIQLIPIVGPIWLLVELGFLRGTIGANRFGADPIDEAMIAGAPA